MGLLEKLRPQPKWKHADPAVRLEGLHEIDDTDQDTLVALATDDPDARVRRAAAARVTRRRGPRGDRPQRERRRRRAISRSTPSGLARRTGRRARRPWRRHRARRRSAGSASWRTRRKNSALASRASQRRPSRSTDPKALGSIARHAADAATRLLAVERLERCTPSSKPSPRAASTPTRRSRRSIA